jgi:hypothetical protein
MSKFSWRYFDYSLRNKDFRTDSELGEKKVLRYRLQQLVLICNPDSMAGVPADGSLSECDSDRAAHPQGRNSQQADTQRSADNLKLGLSRSSAVLLIRNCVVDPDLHVSTLFWDAGSRSAAERRSGSASKSNG